MFLPVRQRADGVAAAEIDAGRLIDDAAGSAFDYHAGRAVAADVDLCILRIDTRAAPAGADNANRALAGYAKRQIAAVKIRALLQPKQRRAASGDVESVVIRHVDVCIRSIGEKGDLIAALSKTWHRVGRNGDRGIAARVNANRAVTAQVDGAIHCRRRFAAALAFHPDAKISRAAAGIGAARDVDHPG